MLLGAAAPCFTKREDFPYGIDKSAVDGLIQQTYRERPSMLKNFSEIFFADPEKLSSEFKIWNLSLGLSASAYATIQCAIELRDADLRSDLKTIGIPTLIFTEQMIVFVYLNWPRPCMMVSKGLNSFLLRKPDMDFIMKRKKN